MHKFLHKNIYCIKSFVKSKIWGKSTEDDQRRGVMRLAKKKLRGVPELGERIKRFMATADLNASELSAGARISTGYLSRILNGEVVNPTIDIVKRIAATLGVTETELVREDVEEPEQVDVEDEDDEAEDEEVPGGMRPALTGESLGAGPTLRSVPTRARTGQQPTETATQQRDQSIKLLVAQIVEEKQLTLTPEKRLLAERLILENAQAVCEVLAKGKD